MHFCESSERAQGGTAVLEPAKLYTIELEPEVRSWLEMLPTADHCAVERFADRLAEDGPLLPFPLSSHLGDGLRDCASEPFA
jgi:hypothetical protein